MPEQRMDHSAAEDAGLDVPRPALIAISGGRSCALPEQDATSTPECRGISVRTEAESEGLAANSSRCGRGERVNAQAGQVVGVSISMDEQKCAVASVGWSHLEQSRE
jgi:hypothetical protein